MKAADTLRFIQNILFLRKPNAQEQGLKSNLNVCQSKTVFNTNNTLHFLHTRACVREIRSPGLSRW